ncbi:hypothetical protein U4E84_11270 [Halorubrum sp. AD140]|uniref:hypothetical protein n=1 Tax=Halorubrum sp. AD140 TaxID=3050073 RepID=UPI002ACCDFE2|nr:hypothetical protein [Halorubrum sp. AD140]MDZ5811921.1 hypothetical protein [Halorubrum sp. AD140]
MVIITALAVILLQGGILSLFVVAVRRRDTAAATNALGSFVLALLPVVIELVLPAVLSLNVSFGPVLPLWLAAAGFLHSLGMLGLYESTWWWDHLTHTVSAALVAALLYAALIVALSNTAGPGDASGTIAAVTVVFTFAIGVFWELIELVARDLGERLDIEPVLIHYGWRDTAVDLGFDIVGAVLVIGADLRIFVPVVEQFPGVTEAILVGSGWIVVVGSVLMALFVGIGGSIRS